MRGAVAGDPTLPILPVGKGNSHSQSTASAVRAGSVKNEYDRRKAFPSGRQPDRGAKLVAEIVSTSASLI